MHQVCMVVFNCGLYQRQNNLSLKGKSIHNEDTLFRCRGI